MVFEHNPALAALHRHVTGNQSEPSPIEEIVAKENEERQELEEMVKEFQEDTRIKRPRRKGFGS